MRVAATQIVWELVFYLGLTPRQLVSSRLVCRRWASLLVQDRFWHRHLAALPPRISPLLGPQPRHNLYAWYMTLAATVRHYFDEQSLDRQRDQQLWEAMLLASTSSTTAEDSVTLTAIGNQCLTRVERDGRCVVVALAMRYFQPHQVELRRLRKKRKYHDPSLERVLALHLWYGDEAKERMLSPGELVSRLLATLFEPVSCRKYKRVII